MWSQMDEELHLDNQTPEHKELMNRLRKTLYFGGLKMPQCKVLTRPLSDLVASQTFIDTHPPYSLKPETVGHIKASPCSLILALIYLDLLKDLDPHYVRRVPPSELLLVAMMVSTKFYSGYDEDVYISEWAEYGHLTVDRLKALEIDFLDAMDWKIYVSNETFFKKLKQIERTLAERETQARGGWLTYTELCTLMPSIEALRRIISYSALLAVSYTAGVLALAGAFFVATQVPGSYLCNSQTHTQTTTTHSTTSPAATTTTTVNSEIGNNSEVGGGVAPTAINSIITDVVTDCRLGGGRSNCRGAVPRPLNYSDLTELEKRLILSGAEWEPLSSADEDGKRIHLNGGTDYWSPVVSGGGGTTRNEDTDDLNRIGVESLAHGTIRKRENETATWTLEWQPYQSDQHDLSFLSYLWLKFL